MINLYTSPPQPPPKKSELGYPLGTVRNETLEVEFNMGSIPKFYIA